MRRVRVLARVGAAALVVLAGLLAQKRPNTSNFSGCLWLWLLGVAWLLLTFVPIISLKTLRRRAERLFRRRWIEMVGLAALLLAALIVRAYDLEHIPVNLGGDEGTWAVEGLAMLEDRLANPFSTRWFAFPSMSFLAWALSMRVFGSTTAGLRALSALLGTASVLTTFFLARELWGRRVAWLAAAFLAFGSYHLHYSRLAVNNIGDPLLATLSLWLLVLGLRRKRAAYFALAGVAVGLGWYAYFGARLIVVIVVAYLAWRLVAERGFLARQGKSLLVLLGVALVVATPLLLHYLAYPDAFTFHSRQINIFASGWLGREQTITGRSAASLLFQQAWKSVSAFNYTLDPTFWYRDSIPLLDLTSGVLFVVGLLWATAYRRRSANGLLLLWLWLTLILGWVVTENPPSSQRLLIVTPALAVLVSLGLDWLAGLSQRLFGGDLRLWSGAVVALVVVVAMMNLGHYFTVYTPARVYGNPTAEIATDLARYLERQNDDYVIYFYAPPVMYWDFGTLRFMSRGVDGMDVLPPEEGEPPEPDPARGARYVFLPHRLGELDAIRARFPEGIERPIYSTADGRLLYVLYEIVLVGSQ